MNKGTEILNDAFGCYNHLEMEPKFEYPDEETAARFRKAYPGYYRGWVRSQPGNLMLPVMYTENWMTYCNFKIRPDDVFVLSHPKSGKLYHFTIDTSLSISC